MSQEGQEWPVTSRNWEEEIGSQWIGKEKGSCPGTGEETIKYLQTMIKTRF
jgi:hypothetical protein